MNDESELKPVLYSIEENLMKRIYFALETARDNAIDVYNIHMDSIVGKTLTTRDRRLTELLKDDADEAIDLIKGLTEKYGNFGI